MSNIPLKTLKFPGLDDTYTIPQVDNTLLTAGAAADAKKTGDEIGDLKEALDAVETTLPTKADKSGVVASAEQLLSDVGTEDKAPYLFRATPYDSTRVDEELVGCSVGWNQYARFNSSNIPTDRYGTTFSTDDEKSCTVNGTCTADNPVTGWFGLHNNANAGGAFTTANIGHVFFFTSTYISGTATDNGIKWTFPTGLGPTSVSSCAIDGGTRLLKPSDSGLNTRAILQIDNGTVLTNYKFSCRCIDLTAWFGSTIADYAYTLEQATAGSGVAWIKALLPGGYIPYSAPTLKSVSGLSAHVMRGFNQWDEEWELGLIDLTTGQNTQSSSNIRSKNYIPILPNTTYFFREPAGMASNGVYYDSEKNVISTLGSHDNVAFTTPANASYMRFYLASAYGKVYKNDICINLSDPARNGTYEPYKANTYALDSDLTLRGILKMDSDHNVYADGDGYGADGAVQRRYDVEVFDGTEEFSNISQYGSYYYISTTATYDASAWQTQDMLANVASTYATGGGVEDKLYVQFDGAKHIRLVSSVFTTKQEFIDFLTGQNSGGNPLTIIYKTSTTTEETADPYASPQNCTPGGTEEYVYSESGSGVVVGHNSRYQKNLKGELERVSVAVPEVGSTAGTYTLKATVTAQGVTYGWVAE